MATLTIRQLDDGVYEALKRDAKANHRSIEAEARLRLGQAARSTEDMVGRFRSSQARLKDVALPYDDSVALVRAVRDEG
jgi:plasmid stability protein